MKIRIFGLALIFLAAGLSSLAAKEVMILYTGETHAMLYPCNCPFEPDGGIARRATLIKELRSENPNVLLLDSGNFFAGGMMDEYSQNTEFDMQRSAINLKALEMMGYDAVNTESSEFNFGRGFLEKNIKKSRTAFVSANIRSSSLKGYVIKEVAGIKFGITGLSRTSVAATAGGWEVLNPKEALKETIARMKKQGVNFTVLLSQLGDKEDAKLAQEIPGIDVIISTRSNKKDDLFTKIGATLALRTAWQGRRLGKLVLSIENNKIVNHKAELLRLSDKIKDDPAISAILPRCFSDANCKKGPVSGFCLDPGKNNARCNFAKSSKVKLLVITHQECAVCDTAKTLEYLKEQFPGLTATYLNYGEPEADKLIADFGIKGLPAYLLGKEAENEENFSNLSGNLIFKDNYYFLNPQAGGMSYFLNRAKIKGRIDVFLSLYDSGAAAILENIREYRPELHFLANEQGEEFSAVKGKPEVEEYLRSVCVQKYYPKNYWDYLTCRAKNINSSWWDECLPKLDAARVSACARGKEGKELLKKNTALNKELEIMFGPFYLMDNQEIFGVQGVPSKEEFKKIFKK